MCANRPAHPSTDLETTMRKALPNYIRRCIKDVGAPSSGAEAATLL